MMVLEMKINLNTNVIEPKVERNVKTGKVVIKFTLDEDHEHHDELYAWVECDLGMKEIEFIYNGKNSIKDKFLPMSMDVTTHRFRPDKWIATFTVENNFLEIWNPCHV